MELLTGQREMDAGPLLNYFRPLYEWLQNENVKTGEYLGWETAKKSNLGNRERFFVQTPPSARIIGGNQRLTIPGWMWGEGFERRAVILALTRR